MENKNKRRLLNLKSDRNKSSSRKLAVVLEEAEHTFEGRRHETQQIMDLFREAADTYVSQFEKKIYFKEYPCLTHIFNLNFDYTSHLFVLCIWLLYGLLWVWLFKKSKKADRLFIRETQILYLHQTTSTSSIISHFK